MPKAPAPIRIVSRLGELAGRYDAVLCDIWGVLHNGKESFAEASDALVAFRQRGGAVVLLTNAPRPNAPIRKQLVKFGISPDAFDDIVTSGDVTAALMAERIDQSVYYIGPERDIGLFDAAAAIAGRNPATAPLDRADYALCTGLVNDEVETPDDYAERLRDMRARDLPFVCANPDIIIHRGHERVYCAGAIAKAYEAIGGKTIYAGKPYAPIYLMALASAEKALGRKLAPERALAIGDGMRTDIAGALGQGLDALFIRAGIHRDDFTGEGALEAELEALFQREQLWPYATALNLAP